MFRLIASLVQQGLAFFNVLVIWKAYAWSLVPWLGLPGLGYWQTFVVVMLIDLFTYSSAVRRSVWVKQDDEQVKKDLAAALATSIAFAVSFGVFAIFHAVL